MKLKEFYEKSYGIRRYEIWYRGMLIVTRCLADVPEQLLDKNIEELEFEEDDGKIYCVIELVD